MNMQRTIAATAIAFALLHNHAAAQQPYQWNGRVAAGSVIEIKGVNGGIRYVVRSVDLRTGKLEPGAIVDKTEPGERMNGVALARAWSGDGSWAYTLYNGGTSHAFVHALNTRARVARCIDLPWAGEAQSILDGARLVLGTKGALRLTDADGNTLAQIDTRTFSVKA